MTYFVDTDVLVYARDSSEPEKQKRAHAWLESLWRNQSGQLSFQVLQEYYVTVTQKLEPGLSTNDARDDVRAFYAWQPRVIDRTVIASAWDVQDRFGLSWWDSVIVAAAQVCDCDHLLTEDLPHQQNLDGLMVVDPFRAELPG